MSQWNLNSSDVEKNARSSVNHNGSNNPFDNAQASEKSPSIVSNPFASEDDFNFDTSAATAHDQNATFATSPIANNPMPFGRAGPSAQRGSVEFLVDSTTPPPAGYFHSSLPHRRRVHTWRDSMSSTSSNPTHHRTESNEKMISTANSTFVNEHRSLVYSEPFARQDFGRNGYAQMNFANSPDDAEQEKPPRKARASYYSISNIAAQGRRTSIPRLLWATFAFLCTFFVPDFVLMYIGRMKSTISRQSWREKIAMVYLFVFFSAFVAFWLEYITSLFCDPPDYFKYTDVISPKSKYAEVNGRAVNMSSWADQSAMAAEVSKYPGYDLSPLFPTFTLLARESGNSTYSEPAIQTCIGDQNMQNVADEWLIYRLSNDTGYVVEQAQITSCPMPTSNGTVSGAPCFYHHSDVEELENGIEGVITYTRDYIYKNRSSLPNGIVEGSGYVILRGKVYDVTDYLVSASDLMNFSSDIMTRKLVLDRMFLPLNLTMLILLNLGQDITPFYEGNVTENGDIYIACMDRLFYKGIVEDAMDTGCAKINPALWATMGSILLLFLFKMNLSNLSRLPIMRRILFSSTENDSYMINSDMAPYTMLMIPCYAEATDVLKQTIESMAITQYADSRKMFMFVCDGTVKNPSAARETYVEILDLLGYSGTEEPIPQAYASLGQGYKKANFAKVYSGFYETGRNRVPYLLVVKVGNARERDDMRRGNRGKRDSMMIAFAFLERCMDLASNRITPLEYQLFNQCYNLLGIDPRMFKYMLVTDADTQVKGTAVQKLVSRLENDERLIAISGDVRPANPEENVTTMLQIFPLYMRFFSGLAYEACLGSMITINGGFVMYRIWQDKSTKTPSMAQSRQSLMSSRPLYSKQSSELQLAIPTSWDSSQDAGDKRATIMTGVESNFSLSPPVDVLACCVHPTVLREFATPPADTLHMRNVLLLGEEQYLSIVLLKSHPRHRLGFEPDAIGYATVPNTFKNLQAQQTRLLRTNFHNNIEMLKVASQIGVSYWILAFTKVLDTVVSPVMMVYLYSVFIRFFIGYGLAYEVIAICFLGLVGLHIFYFLLRKQFKYVLWFLLYCFAAVPLFNIWFPLVALWCSNYADQWYDIWKTDGAATSGRLHGVIDTELEKKEKEEPDQGTLIMNDKNAGRGGEWQIPRMRLSEFESAEGRQRTAGMMFEDFDAELLDSDFNGFAGQSPRMSMNSVSSKRYNSNNGRSGDDMISSPPMAQVRDGLHSVRTLGGSGRKYDLSSSSKMKKQVRQQPHLRDIFDDLQLLPPPNRHDSDSMMSPDEVVSDPFASAMDNPFDDSYATSRHHLFGDSASHLAATGSHSRPASKHQPTQSQSSYLSFSSRSTNDPHFVTQSTFADMSTLPSSINSSGFASMPRANRLVNRPKDVTGEYSKSVDDLALNDRNSIRSNLSLAESYVSSNLSLDPEESMATMYSVPRSALAQHRRQASEPNKVPLNEEEDGRRAAQHSRLGIRIPAMEDTTVENRSYSPSPPVLPIISSTTAKQPTLSDTEFRESVKREIASYLQHADLDRVTRAKVKQHLFNKFGKQVDESQEMQTFVHDSIEQATLDRLTRG